MAVIRFTVFSSSNFVKFVVVVVERLKKEEEEEEEEASSCISSVAINQSICILKKSCSENIQSYFLLLFQGFFNCCC